MLNKIYMLSRTIKLFVLSVAQAEMFGESESYKEDYTGNSRQ
jgi:hypothetical protein